MAFALPVFNIAANIWRAATPVTDPPDLVVAAQLYLASRGLLDITPADNALWQPPVYLRVPPGTDIRVEDQVEAAAGDAWFYRVRFVERTHRGFPNEYISAIMEQTSTGPPVPPTGFDVLMESGDHVLLESGDKVLLE